MVEMKKQRIVVVGLDGARHSVMKKWFAEGKLPYFKKLCDEGVFCELEANFPPHSMNGWTSIVTGNNPGKHGIYGIQIEKANSYENFIPDSTHIHGEKLYDILSENNKVVGIINLPLTYPAHKLNGIMVTDFLTPPLADYTYPKNFREKLDKIGYKILPEKTVRKEAGFFEENVDTMLKRFEAAKIFIEQFHWDFLFLAITETEEMHHNYASFLDKKHPNYQSGFEEKVIEFYQKAEAETKKLVDECGENTAVFIVSDHGFGPQYGMVYLNRLFEKNGLFKTKKRFDPVRSLITTIARLGLRSKAQKLVNILPFKMPKKLEKFLREKSYETSNADWPKTKVFCAGRGGEVRLNLKGREPQGTVSREEFEEFRKKVCETIMNAPELKGKVKKVHLKEELYWGPFLESIPDLFVEFEKPYLVSMKTGNVPIIEEKLGPIEGNHTRDAIFIAAGHGIKKNPGLAKARLFDVMPTILQLFGLPVPDGIDGKCLPILENAEQAKAGKAGEGKAKVHSTESAFDEEGEEAVKNRLAGFGYI
ncbi:MAG: alkaline phosphatase family protein [Candidatus Diapherotrites archaeon]|nr:alkaline phosphatase family protein [Candidatus Diapherotrites archaeon]